MRTNRIPAWSLLVSLLGAGVLVTIATLSCNGRKKDDGPAKDQGEARTAPADDVLIARDHIKVGSPRDIRFHPKGEVIAVGSEGVVEIREGSSLRFLYALAEEGKEPQYANSLDFSPDGQHLAVDYSPDPEKPYVRGIAIWDWKARKAVARMGTHQKEIWCVRYSRDGKLLATASEDKTVRIWSVAENKLLKTLEGFPMSVVKAEFSPDGKYLASEGITYKDAFIRVYRTDTWDVDSDLKLEGVRYFEGVAFSPDSVNLYSTCDRLVGWQVGSWKHILDFKPTWRIYGYVSRNLTVSPDGKLLAIGTQSEGVVRLYRISDKREVSTQVFPGGAASHITGLDFSSDGLRLAVAGANGCAIVDVAKAMR